MAVSKPSTITRLPLEQVLDLAPAVAAADATAMTRTRAPGELALGIRRPLDEGDPPRAEVVGEQVGVLVLEPGEAVEVEVRDGQALAGAVAVADAEASGW